jgi:serine/threonine-protein phosphatase 4 regulatory subunit 1
MVNRMNNPTSLSPAMLQNSDKSLLHKASLMSESKSIKGYWDSDDYLCAKIPFFIERFHNDAQVMIQILQHRDMNPPSSLDVTAITDKLIPHYVDLATIVTGDENIDAEMRVYCAYSFPAVLLLLGRDAWNTSLKKCFLSLVTGSPSVNDIKLTIPASSSNLVPLPVKRCLAASFHTICLILGPQFVMKSLVSDAEIDMMTLFEHYFLKDSDEATTLNVMRNLPALLSLLSPNRRTKFLPIFFEIVSGDSMLGILAKKRSAMNTTQLNWRQRDMIAQILPYLIMLYRPYQVRQYLWPIAKLLMSDPVSIVREHIEWSIPILLRVYEPSNCNLVHDDGDGPDVNGKKDPDMAKLSAEACSEVLSYLSSNLLHPKTIKSDGPSSSFGKRQCYCRIVATVALVVRLRKSEKRKTMVRKGKSVIHPFYNLNSDESRHLMHVLQNYLLPSCMAMKDDKVANVRQALFQCLRLLPSEIREQSEIKGSLLMLEEELNTWDGDGIVFNYEKQMGSIFSEPR